MSRSQEIPSRSIVRRWTTEDVVLALQQNGLGDVVQCFRKRNIDGNAFLGLTEMNLKMDWKRELSFTNIGKIVKLIGDINAQTDKPSLPPIRQEKPFDVRIPAKPKDLPGLKPMASSLWNNQRKKSDVVTQSTNPSVFGGRVVEAPPTLPTSGSRNDPKPPPTFLWNRAPQISSPGNKPDPNPPGSGDLFDSIQSAGRSRREPSPGFPLSVSQSRRDVPSPSSSINTLPFPCVATPSFQDAERKPKPPLPTNKPQLPKDKCTVVRTSSCEPNGSRERNAGASYLQELLLAAARRNRTEKADSDSGQQNGWPEEKSAKAVHRPAAKLPVASRPLPQNPTKPGLPTPPSIFSGNEADHMKEIVNNIQIPSLPPNVNETNDNEGEMYENASVGIVDEIYEEPDPWWETEQQPSSAGEDTGGTEKREPIANEDNSDLYECIPDSRCGSEYYVEPTAGVVNTTAKTEFESTHIQVEELPVAPSVPSKTQGGHFAFMSSLRPHIFRSSESKPSETQPSKDNNLLTKRDNLEPKTHSVVRSMSPKREKLNSELRKDPSSSTTSLITPNKGNAVQSPSLPDQRLPPNLRPLPPTPGISSFRSGPPSNTLPAPRKISNSVTSITQQPWYHNVDRRRGEEIVCNGEDGTFLIRPSSQNQNPYTLTIWFGKRVYNIAIRFRPDQKFALGSKKTNEQSFWSLEEMVTYYQTEQLVLYSGGERTGQTSLKSFP